MEENMITYEDNQRTPRNTCDSKHNQRLHVMGSPMCSVGLSPAKVNDNEIPCLGPLVPKIIKK